MDGVGDITAFLTVPGGITPPQRRRSHFHTHSASIVQDLSCVSWLDLSHCFSARFYVASLHHALNPLDAGVRRAPLLHARVLPADGIDQFPGTSLPSPGGCVEPCPSPCSLGTSGCWKLRYITFLSTPSRPDLTIMIHVSHHTSD